MFWYFVLFLAGSVIGSVIGEIVRVNRAKGILRLDTSQPTEEPYLFLELRSSPLCLEKKRYVLLRVNSESYIPRK